MEYLLTVPGTLRNFNDYTKANRSSPYKGAKMKARSEGRVVIAIKQCMRGVQIAGPVFMEYT